MPGELINTSASLPSYLPPYPSERDDIRVVPLTEEHMTKTKTPKPETPMPAQLDLLDIFRQVGPIELPLPKLPRRRVNPKRRAVLVLTPSK